MAKAAKTDSRFGEKLLKHRQAIAAEFGIEDISDWRVRRLALLEAQFASAEDQIAAGRSVDTGPLLALDSAIQDIRQQLKADEPLNITVHFVSGVTGIFNCTKCGHRNEIEDYKRPAPPPAPPPTPPEAVYARPIDEVEKPASAPVKPDKASPPVTHRPGVSASAFHSQIINGHCAAEKASAEPLRHAQCQPTQQRERMSHEPRR